MPISSSELIRALAVLTDREDMRVSGRRSAQGAVISSAATFLGGLLLGPVGMAIGGAVGGITAMMTQGDFRSAAEILLNDLSEGEVDRLMNHLRNAVERFEVTDLAMLVPLLATNATVKQAVLTTVMNFITNDLGMSIIN